LLPLVGRKVPEHLANAKRYRQRAEDLRKLAAATEEAELRAPLSRLADEYDRMANAAEEKSAIKISRA
jgi:hypothetical protein